MKSLPGIFAGVDNQYPDWVIRFCAQEDTYVNVNHFTKGVDSRPGVAPVTFFVNGYVMSDYRYDVYVNFHFMRVIKYSRFVYFFVRGITEKEKRRWYWSSCVFV